MFGGGIRFCMSYGMRMQSGRSNLDEIVPQNGWKKKVLCKKWGRVCWMFSMDFRCVFCNLCLMKCYCCAFRLNEYLWIEKCLTFWIKSNFDLNTVYRWNNIFGTYSRYITIIQFSSYLYDSVCAARSNFSNLNPSLYSILIFANLRSTLRGNVPHFFLSEPNTAPEINPAFRFPLHTADDSLPLDGHVHHSVVPHEREGRLDSLRVFHPSLSIVDPQITPVWRTERVPFGNTTMDKNRCHTGRFLLGFFRLMSFKFLKRFRFALFLTCSAFSSVNESLVGEWRLHFV